MDTDIVIANQPIVIDNVIKLKKKKHLKIYFLI